MPDPLPAPVRVLYLGGTGRTGSTLVERVLGNLPGVFAAGETTWLWYALRSGGRCSCGSPHLECPVWGPALGRAFGRVDRGLADEMFRLRRRHDSRHLPLMCIPGLAPVLRRRLGAFPERMAALYRSLAETTGAGVVVDASKEPHLSSILRERPELDLWFLHLVRDPRAVAYSWQRTRQEAGFGEGHVMERRGVGRSALYYDVSNIAGEALWRGRGERYHRIRYEDFVADPTGTLAGVAEWLGVEWDLSAVLTGSTATLSPTHSAWGNPNRFERGPVTIRDDAAWRGAAPEPLGEAWRLTSWVARRYGYRREVEGMGSSGAGEGSG